MISATHRARMAVIPFARSLEKISAVSARPTAASGVVPGVQQATGAATVPFAVSRIDASQMPVPAANALTQIQGKVPGANIVSSSGRPGAQPSVLLRGVTSLNGQGRGQDPLYIV